MLCSLFHPFVYCDCCCYCVSYLGLHIVNTTILCVCVCVCVCIYLFMHVNVFVAVNLVTTQILLWFLKFMNPNSELKLLILLEIFSFLIIKFFSFLSNVMLLKHACGWWMCKGQYIWETFGAICRYFYIYIYT